MYRIASWLLGGMGLLLLWALVSRARSYRRLLSDAHFLAIASGAADLKRAARERVIRVESDAIADARDARVLRTGAGLALVYTVTLRGGDFVHHCSVSFPGQHVAQGSTELFLQFAVRVLGFPVAQTRCEQGSGAVKHAECALSATQHAALGEQPALDLSIEHLRALRLEAMNARRSERS